MGREVKRVPMAFDWPLKTTWPGYLMGVCEDETGGCKNCRHFARLAGIALVPPGDCPKTTMDPPAGSAWQMWETTSEGSPISPPCESPEALAHWLADNHASACGHEPATYEQWLGMIDMGSAPTLMMFTGDHPTIMSGVAAVGRKRTGAKQ